MRTLELGLEPLDGVVLGDTVLDTHSRHGAAAAADAVARPVQDHVEVHACTRGQRRSTGTQEPVEFPLNARHPRWQASCYFPRTDFVLMKHVKVQGAAPCLKGSLPSCYLEKPRHTRSAQNGMLAANMVYSMH